MDGVRIAREYAASLSLAGAETRVFNASLTEVFSGGDYGWNFTQSATERVRGAGAAVNRGTQLLYIHGRARAALGVIADCRNRLLSRYWDNTEALLFNTQLSINTARLHRALGRPEAMQAQLITLASDVRAVVANGVTRVCRLEMETAVRHVRWLEPYKCAWRTGDYALCKALAASAGESSSLGQESLLRSCIELGEYDFVIRSALANPSGPPWWRVYAAVALCRGGALAEFEQLASAIANQVTPLANLRLASEAAFAQEVGLARELAKTAFAAADKDPSSQILAGALLFLIDPDWRNSAQYVRALRVFQGDRHNVVRIICLAMAGSAPARTAAQHILTVVDRELVDAHVPSGAFDADKTESLCRTGQRLGDAACADAERIESFCRQTVQDL